MKTIFLIILFTFNIILNAQTNYPALNNEINEGNITNAETRINNIIKSNNLSLSESNDLSFQIEKMHRIKLDFGMSYDDIIIQLKKYYPDVDRKMIESWEADRSLEMKVIDGQKMIFQ
jgi:hypothetical protein